MLTGTYSYPLVLLSLAVAVLAAYTSLSMANRVRSATIPMARWWLAGGSLAMGLGVWSMHFVGMLAFRLPIALGYDLFGTLFSLAVAVACSGFVLWFVRRGHPSPLRLLLAATLMGTGIAAMHYIGMDALLMWPGIVYEWRAVLLSLLIAMFASGVALWLAFYQTKRLADQMFFRMMSAIVMGCAIVGMHYTGMAAAGFPAGSVCLAANIGISSNWLAVIVAGISTAVLVLALVIATLDANRRPTAINREPPVG